MNTEKIHTGTSIDGSTFRKMVMNAGASMQNNADTINDLNVFPVPDGDTGSNMSMTIGSAVSALRESDTDGVGDVAAETATAMLRGARGNSGVILSLLFRGMSKALNGESTCDGRTWAKALRAGVDAAYGAVSSPAEGTILTVARMAADRAIEAAERVNDLGYVLDEASEAAGVALADTVNQNPVLKKAGVVDAGGMGWVIALNAMRDAVYGKAPVFEGEITRASAVRESADFAAFEEADIRYPYCTEFIVARENARDAQELRAYLGGMGDSLVLVEDEEIIKVHVHTDAPGTVMQEALRYGSFISVKVENMRLQHSAKLTAEPPRAAADYGVVAVCPGEGIAETFRSLGVDAVVSGGQTMNPSTEDILRAVEGVEARTVFVLPNNKNIVLTAAQAADLSERQIVVIPTHSITEGIAAMQRYDIDLSAEEIAAGMRECAEATDTMQVTYAARDSSFDGMSIAEGDYLALYGGRLAGNGRDLTALAAALAARATARGKEIITIYYGQDVSEVEAEQLAAVFAEQVGEDNVMIIDGGQPVYYYIIAAE